MDIIWNLLTSATVIFIIHCLYISEILNSTTSAVICTNCCTAECKETQNNSKEDNQEFHFDFVIVPIMWNWYSSSVCLPYLYYGKLSIFSVLSFCSHFDVNLMHENINLLKGKQERLHFISVAFIKISLYVDI